MGGDSFQGTEKLTNLQYIQITTQLLQILRPLCQRIEPYIPLPQKQIHGDVDFLIILKDNLKPKDIINQLKIQKFIMNNNSTINSVFKNKQVDFSFVNNQKQFQLASFYKSYSGIGAFLGLFLPSKQIKVTTNGIIALGFHQHLKVEVTLSENVDQILQFYGLDSKKYKQGFKTRKQLFEYIRNVRFLDEQKFAYFEHKNSTKLIKGLEEYLKSSGINKNKKVDIFQDPLEETLKYFKKKQEYENTLKSKIEEMERIQNLNKKFNPTHLFQAYEIAPKEINKIKNQFNKDMFQNDMAKYYDWIESNEIQEIVKAFGEKLNLKHKVDKKEQQST